MCKFFWQIFFCGYIENGKAHVVSKLQFCALSLSRPQQLECCLLRPLLLFSIHIWTQTCFFLSRSKIFNWQFWWWRRKTYPHRFITQEHMWTYCPDGTLAFEQTNYFSTKTLSIQMLLKLDRPIYGYFCPPQYLSWPLSRLFLTCAISVDVHLEYSLPQEKYWNGPKSGNTRIGNGIKAGSWPVRERRQEGTNTAWALHVFACV